MRLLVAVVGKPRNAALAEAISEYETRAARYWPLEVHEVREERASGMTAAIVKEREGARLLERAGNARVVACDVGGKSFTSEQFSSWLQKEREAERDTAFVIGGAFGLSNDVLSESATKISLASWTLPHPRCRLVREE